MKINKQNYTGLTSNQVKRNNRIENELYSKYDVKKGLRNEDGTGVLVGLTKIADVVFILIYCLIGIIKLEWKTEIIIQIKNKLKNLKW